MKYFLNSNNYFILGVVIKFKIVVKFQTNTLYLKVARMSPIIKQGHYRDSCYTLHVPGAKTIYFSGCN